MKRWWWLLALFLWGCAGKTPLTPESPSPPSYEAIPVQPEGAWTLIFYFAADNNLEQAQLDDLEELTRLEWSPQVHALALMDRSPLGESGEGYSNRAVANQANWSGAKLLEVQRDKLIELEDWGKPNMADPKTLERLLVVAQKAYPARHVALFVVDHGHAWAGLCQDEGVSQSDDLLNLTELTSALKALKAPLDLLALDACSMATLEVYLATARSSRYVVASQDSLPGQGLDYTRALKALFAHPDFDGRQLGHSFLEAYRGSLRDDPLEFSQMQLSLLDCGPHRALSHAWQELVERLQPGPDWLEVAKGRSNAQAFQHDCDLGQLAEQWKQRFPRLAALEAELRQALAQVVVEQARGSFRQRCTGLNVFFPGVAEELPQDYLVLMKGSLQAWGDFLHRYTVEESNVESDVPLTEVTLSGGGARLELRARLGDPERVAKSYTILVKDHKIVGQMTCVPAAGSSLLSDFFDGTWLALREKSATASILAHLESVEFESEASSVAMARLPCLLQRQESATPVEVELRFALYPEQPGRPALLVEVLRQQTVIPLEPGNQLAFLEPPLLPGGHPGRGPWLRLTHPDQLQLTLSPTPPESYDELGFLVIDLQGRRHWQTRAVLSGE